MDCEIVENNREFRYMVFRSKFIEQNLSDIEYQTNIIADVIKERLGSESSDVTWLYKKYNVFNYAAGSPAYFQIFKDTVNCIRYYCKEYSAPTFNLWMRNWLNFHDYDEVLKLHGHDVTFHGYISINPQYTETIFVDDLNQERYAITNQIGQIYLGPGRRNHYVKNIKEYEGKRITIGMDLETDIPPGVNLGCLPILI